MFAALISDLAVLAGMTLVVLGLYFLAMVVVAATRRRDDRIVGGRPLDRQRRDPNFRDGRGR